MKPRTACYSFGFMLEICSRGHLLLNDIVKINTKVEGMGPLKHNDVHKLCTLLSDEQSHLISASSRLQICILMSFWGLFLTDSCIFYII